jgi:hypothetical protein
VLAWKVTMRLLQTESHCVGKAPPEVPVSATPASSGTEARWSLGQDPGAARTEAMGGSVRHRDASRRKSALCPEGCERSILAGSIRACRSSSSILQVIDDVLALCLSQAHRLHPGNEPFAGPLEPNVPLLRNPRAMQHLSIPRPNRRDPSVLGEVPFSCAFVSLDFQLDASLPRVSLWPNNLGRLPSIWEPTTHSLEYKPPKAMSRNDSSATAVAQYGVRQDSEPTGQSGLNRR